MNKLIFFLPLICFSQDDITDYCNSKVEEIYKDIIFSIGNNFPPPPKLIFSDQEKDVAYISNKGIVIEKKVIDLFCNQDNFEDKIAYVISHELAHHYLNHSWMNNTSLGYVSSIGDFIQKKAVDIDQRKLAESQADLFGGFFGQISGYNVLGYGKEVLQNIYDSYGISDEVKGYPSLNERFQIIDSKVKEARSLRNLFDLGNILLRFGKFELAKECFEDILKNNFTSREIYNNLGTVYLLYGISIIDNKIGRLKFPVNIDYTSRVDTRLTRSGKLFTDHITML